MFYFIGYVIKEHCSSIASNNVVKKLPNRQMRTTSQIGQSVLYPGMERSNMICLGRRARWIDCLFYLPHWKMVVQRCWECQSCLYLQIRIIQLMQLLQNCILGIVTIKLSVCASTQQLQILADKMVPVLY